MRALIVLVLLAGVGWADDPAVRKAAEKHFRIGAKAYAAQNFAAAAEHFEEAYKLLPLPELAFSAAQAYRRQYRIDREIARARRAVELYRFYLDAVKTGGHVGAAADGLDSMERELLKHGADASRPAAAPAVERTTIIINPELGSERERGGMFEIADITDADTTQIKALLDGKPAPVYEKIDVAPGPHRIVVEAPGYLPADVTERAVQGTTITASITLAPRPAKVTVATEAGARIRVDGRPHGTGPRAELELPAGRHVIAISKRGRESVARELTVTRGQTLVVDEPLEKTTRRKAVPWVAAGAGVFALLSTTAIVGAIVYDGRAANQLDAFQAEGDKSPADVAEYDRLVERRDRLTTAAWITGGAALLVGSAAVALYIFDSPGDAEIRVTPAATSAGAGVVVGGRF